MTRPASAVSPLVVVAVALSSACGDDVGSTGAASAVPSFTRVNAEVLEPSCTFACHSGGEFAAGGLDLQLDPHGALVGRLPAAAVCTGSEIELVRAGDPDASLLYLKIVAKTEGVAAPCGEGMPSGANKPALTSEQVELVRAWIAGGAPRE